MRWLTLFTCNATTQMLPCCCFYFFLFSQERISVFFATISILLCCFQFILNFVYKVVTGQIKEVEDTREEEVIEKMKRKKLSSNGSANGAGGYDNQQQNAYILLS